MTQPSLDFNRPQTHQQQEETSSKTFHNEAQTKDSLENSTPSARQINSDILLNTFQIKKKRYRVLLNNDHIVWEAFDAKRNSQNNEKISQKETEYESEQLSNKAAYGYLSNVVHINEIIRVSKGNTKSSATRVKLLSSQATQTPSAESPNQTAPTNNLCLPPTEQYLCIHYAERIVASSTDCNRWKIRSLTLYNSDAYLVRQWHSILNKKLQFLHPNRIKRLLVFINPYGGRKQGLQTYENHCKNLFLLAGIDPSCIISQRANQIRDILMTHDLTQYDAVCCVGGDGTAAEVINGLLFRAMSDNKVDFQKPSYIPKPSLPVGIIPAGSTDTIAYSLHGTSDVRTAAIHLILGQKRGLDISSVSNGQGLIRFCASVLSYGYLGDVAAKSEKYRWMGTKRYEFTGVKAFLLNRGYEAEINILMPEEDEEQASSSLNVLKRDSPMTPPNSPDSVCLSNCQRCSLASTLSNRFSINQRQSFADCHSDNEEEEDEKGFPQRNEPIRSSNIFKDAEEETDDAYINPNCDINIKKSQENLTSQPTSPEVVLRQKILENSSKVSTKSLHLNFSNLRKSRGDGFVANMEQGKWKTLKGSFFMISGANITCACSRSPKGISRFCHLGDGYLDLILVRKTSLVNNVKFLLNTVGQNGDIRNLPFVEVYRTRQFGFRTHHSSMIEGCSLRGSTQPIADSFNTDDLDNTEISRWNCDGEVVNDLDITMTSHCQLVDVFMRGPYAYQTEEVKRSFFCCCRRT